MDKTQFSVFKYRHGDRLSIGLVRLLLIVLGLVAGILGLVLAFPVGAVLFVVPLVIYFSTPRKLLIGPRYLICGRAIVYYGNVVHVALDENEGILRLRSANDREFVLERGKFPTNARKTDKIARNKAAKFGKVSAKLIEKILRASPAVELVGISRAAYQH